jgi:hypothetical protein
VDESWIDATNATIRTRPIIFAAGAASMVIGLQLVSLASPGTRLGGGSDEIQLNVLGERSLGLPREPSSDRDVPYRDLKVGTQIAGET